MAHEVAAGGDMTILLHTVQRSNRCELVWRCGGRIVLYTAFKAPLQEGTSVHKAPMNSTQPPKPEEQQLKLRRLRDLQAPFCWYFVVSKMTYGMFRG